MLGKELKEVVAMIPDDAEVGFGTNEDTEGSFYDPSVIIGATAMTIVRFRSKEKETTLIFDIGNTNIH